MSDDFKILEDGTIQRGEYTERELTDNEKLRIEFSQLEYEVNHLTRPTKDPVKIERYNNLKKLLNINQTDVLKAAKEKLKIKDNNSNSILKAAIENYKKTNE